MSKDVEHATQIVVPSINGHNPSDQSRTSTIRPRLRKLLAEAKAAGVPVDKEIEIVGRINIYPNATETMEAMMAMLQAGRIQGQAADARGGGMAQHSHQTLR